MSARPAYYFPLLYAAVNCGLFYSETRLLVQTLESHILADIILF